MKRHYKEHHSGHKKEILTKINRKKVRFAAQLESLTDSIGQIEEDMDLGQLDSRLCYHLFKDTSHFEKRMNEANARYIGKH